MVGTRRECFAEAVSALAALVMVTGAACGGGAQHMGPHDAAAEGSGPSLDERITSLGAHEYLVISVGDVDGDGRPEIVLSSADTVPAARSGALHAAQDGPDPVSERTAALTGDDPTAVVLKSDAGGMSILSGQSTLLSLGKLTTAAVVRTAKASVTALQAAMRNPESCALATRVVETFSIGVQDVLALGNIGPVALIGVNDFLSGYIGSVIDDSPRSQSFLECLASSPQTPAGCFGIMASRYLGEGCGADPTGTICKYFGSRAHCYQVSDGTSGTTCEGGNHPESPLCDRADPSGCCNADFVFNTILPANIQNIAPMPLSPAVGPVTSDVGFPVTLDGPSLDVLVQGLHMSLPMMPTLSCLFSGAIATRNPIKIDIDRGKRCVTNTTQPGHMLDGTVTQCVEERGGAVTSNITGVGDAGARLAYLNEQVGPIILATVRDKLKASVTTALADINKRGLCCDGKTLMGATPVPQSDGTLAFPPVGAPPTCRADTAQAQCHFETAAPTARQRGSVVHGGEQRYSLQASAGQGIFIRLAEVGNEAFLPAFSVLSPTGAVLVNGAVGDEVAGAGISADASGTFTILVYDRSAQADAVGVYDLYTVVAPGTDACGTLSPGGVVAGQLAKGAIDSYTFTAEVGQGVALSLTDVAGGALVPAFSVYDPSGAVAVNVAVGDDVASAGFAAPASGTYTVVVYDRTSGSDATGPYKLYFTRAPGANKGGALSPGGVVAGQLAEGAIDSYTFTAEVGQGVALSITDVAGGALIPAFNVYDPAGAIIINGMLGDDVASAGFAAPGTGIYTVIIYDRSVGHAAMGPYKVYFTRAPGANKGGALSPGGVVSAQLAEGAIDSYTFTANSGQIIGLRVTDVSGGALNPAFVLYDPSGAIVVNGASGEDVASASIFAPATGTYTVIVYDRSAGHAATGPYTVALTVTTPPP
jgi:hypothetical protein